MSTLSIGIIFAIIAIWAAIIISMICNCIEKCVTIKYIGKYIENKESYSNAQKVLDNFRNGKRKEGDVDGQ